MKILLHFRCGRSILSISKRGGTGSAAPVPERPMSRHVDVFLHIPKTGGTTLSTIFRRNFKPVELLDHESLVYRREGHMMLAVVGVIEMFDDTLSVLRHRFGAHNAVDRELRPPILSSK
jgi:hypothetical protein